jgi:hypothetical protein
MYRLKFIQSTLEERGKDMKNISSNKANKFPIWGDREGGRDITCTYVCPSA